MFDNDKPLNINVKNNSRNELYLISFKDLNSFHIETNQIDTSCLKIFFVFVNKNAVKINIDSNVNGSNNTLKIFVRGINYKNIDIVFNSKIKEQTLNNGVLQDVKIINESGFVKVDPNLLIDSFESSANHKLSVYDISEKELFYLKTKGLSTEKSKKIIKRGLLYGILGENIKKIVKEEYNE